MSRYYILIGLVIFVLSFVLRYEYIMHTEIIQPIRADAKQYFLYAYNLVEHGVYSKQEVIQGEKPFPDSFRSPGYPLLIAGCLLIGGLENFYPLLFFVQVLISSAVPVIAFLITLRLLNIWWAMLISLFVSLSPHLISMSSYMLTETLFSFFIILALYLYFEYFQAKRFYLLILSSVVWGLAYLTNETAFFIPFFLACISGFYIWRRSLEAEFSLKNIIVFVVIFSLFPISWSIRNHVMIPEDVQKGSSRALNTITHGSYIDFIYETERFRYFPYYEDPMQPAISNSASLFLSTMRKRFKERPYEYIEWYLVKKPYYLWSWNILQGQGDIYVYPVSQSLYTEFKFMDSIRIAFKTIHPLLMVFFLFGTFLAILKPFFDKNVSKVQQIGLLCIGFIVIYYTLLYMVFAPWPRYAVPLRPFFFFLSAYAIFQVCKLIRDRSHVHSAPRGS